MKLAAIFFLGAGLLVIANAYPSLSDNGKTDSAVLPAGISSSLHDDLQKPDVDTNLTPLVREKRSKKKVVVINHYYQVPPGGHGRYPYQSPYPYYSQYDSYGHHEGSKKGKGIGKKLMKYVG